VRIQFLLNGRPVHVDDPPTSTTLLDFIRSRGLTGAKEGCAEGECGACAVAIVMADGHLSAYRPINSCLVPLPMADGHEVLTVESLMTDGRLSDVQLAMAAGGASQCGYCTPGFVVSLFAEQYRRDRRDPCDIEALTGNLCRCTGYRPIRDAAAVVPAAPDDRFRRRLDEPAPILREVSVPGFSRPATVEACLSILRSDPGAKIVCGATDVAVEANLLGRRWAHLISLDGIDELREFSDDQRRIRIGAALPLAEIGRLWRDAPAAVHQWLSLFASPLIRHRATLGGNLATASPIGDAAPLLLALDATVHLRGTEGARAVSISAFFAGYRKTAALAGELITAIEIPKPLPDLFRFYKISKRRYDDISTVAAAIALAFDDNRRVRAARLAFGGVAPTPIRSVEAEAALVGQPWSAAAVERAQEALDRALSPISDHRGSREYRSAVAKSLIDKCLWESSQ
jgi:xanthine dehydrogenase small subunit